MVILFVTKTKSVGVESPLFEMELSIKKVANYGIETESAPSNSKCPVTKLQDTYRKLKETSTQYKKSKAIVKSENIPQRIIKGFYKE